MSARFWVVAFAVVLAGCGDGDDAEPNGDVCASSLPSGNDVGFEVVDHGTVSVEHGCDDECCGDAFVVVARSALEFAHLSATVLGGRSLPEGVDFSSQRLLIVGLGHCRPEDRAGLEVCAVREGAPWEVEVVRTRGCPFEGPGGNRPFAILLVDRSDVGDEVQAVRLRTDAACR